MRRFAAVVFDIDGTLTPEISWTSMTREMGAPVEKHIEIFQNFLNDKISYEESKRQLLALWHGTENATKQFIEKLFTNFPIRPEAEEVVRFLHTHSYTVCLITGSIDIYAETIAQGLGIIHYFAGSELVWDEKGKLVDFHYPKDQGKRKLEHLQQFCREQKLNPKRCLVVGDDHNDIQLFTYTGNGVALRKQSPPELQRVAWRTIDSLLELKELVGDVRNRPK